MTLEGFVRAAGAAMGLARDSFGTGAAGEVGPAADAPPMPGGSAPGSGRAVEASNTESAQLTAHAAALSDRNDSAHAQLAAALAAARSGRARMDGIIDGATADVHALAPASLTPRGRRALVTALTQRLQDTQRALQDGQAGASTHAASSHAAAADYRAVAPLSPAAASAAPPPGTSMGAMPLAGLGSLPGMLGAEPGEPGGRSQGQRTATGAATPDGSTVDAVVSRALSQHGTPYSWGGGGKTGPGRGDDGRVGFDCSSLMQYAFAGTGMDLPRTTLEQIGLGRQVRPGDIQAGDLIFSNFDGRGPGHVQLAISSTHVVEAPHTGDDVRVSAVPAGHIVVKRILG